MKLKAKQFKSGETIKCNNESIRQEIWWSYYRRQYVVHVYDSRYIENISYFTNLKQAMKHFNSLKKAIDHGLKNNYL